MKLLQRSLVARISASLLSISAMALISIVVTMAIAGSNRGDAAAINQAGSLRMNAFQIVVALQRYEKTPSDLRHRRVEELATQFRSRLEDTRITAALPGAEDHSMQVQYRRLLSRWNSELTPLVEQALASTSVPSVQVPGVRTITSFSS